MTTEHECGVICWEYGCNYHEVCTIGICIPAGFVAAEYRRQADAAAKPEDRALLNRMAAEVEARA